MVSLGLGGSRCNAALLPRKAGEGFLLEKAALPYKGGGVSHPCILRRTVGGGGANGMSHRIKGDDTLGEGSVYNISP